jgi:hypothetical protein
LRAWLGPNHATVMSVLLLVLDVALFGEGFDTFD